MKIIPEWRRCLRMFSFQAMSVATAIQLTWIGLPEDMKATVPQPWVFGATVVVLVLGMFGRLVDQPKVSGGSDG